MTFRRALATLVCLAVVAIVAIGVSKLPGGSSTGTSGGGRLTGGRVNALLAGSPPSLAALHAQADALLGGGASALHAPLAPLAGYPRGVAQGASWVGP